MAQVELTVNLFTKNKEVENVVQQFVDAADDAGFELKRIVTAEDEAVEDPADPSRTVSEDGFYKSTFIQRDQPQSITFAEGSSPSDSPFDIYVVHFGDINRKAFTDEGQKTILRLIRSLASHVSPYMIYLGDPGDEVVANRQHLTRDFGLGYITYYGPEITEQLDADISRTPVGLTERIGNGWLIAGGEKFMEDEQRLDEISDFLGVRSIRPSLTSDDG